jgi:putative aldouronate transport system substrate-binding protein
MSTKKVFLFMAAMALTIAMAACSSNTTTQTASGGGNSEGSGTQASDSQASGASEQADETITYTFLMNWNGGASSFPNGWENGQVAQLIMESTGIKLEVETIVSSETEKLAMVFASGDVPDIVNAPFWSTNPGGEGEQIMRAAEAGLLLGLNQYVMDTDDFPWIKQAMTENIAQPFIELHLEHPSFDGERYVIPRKPMTQEDVTNWAYTVYARKDILDDLGVDPQSVTNYETLRSLLERISAGGYEDINGRPVIPAGNWHNGWSFQQYWQMFHPGGVTEWEIIDGRIEMPVFTQPYVDKVLFMRNLIADGLYDAEALMQTDTMAKEKLVTGRVATHGVHFPAQFDFFTTTLYLTNPEMEYLPLGPFPPIDGDGPWGWIRNGAYGFGCLFLSANVQNPERALGLIEYLSTDEGFKLVQFGIEGIHYTMVDGLPTYTEEWQTIKNENRQGYNMEGFGFSELNVEDRKKGYGWDPSYNVPQWVFARSLRPFRAFDGFTVDDISGQWPGRLEYNERTAVVNLGDLEKQMITADSDEAAIAMIEDYRRRLLEAGYNEMMDYVQQRMDEDPSIVY